MRHEVFATEAAVSSHDQPPGRLVKAPENFISPEGVRAVVSESKAGRRNFVRVAFATALAGASSPAALAQANPVPTEGGDPNILELPAHSKGLGRAVATDSYGKPPK